MIQIPQILLQHPTKLTKVACRLPTPILGGCKSLLSMILLGVVIGSGVKYCRDLSLQPRHYADAAVTFYRVDGTCSQGFG